MLTRPRDLNPAQEETYRKAEENGITDEDLDEMIEFIRRTRLEDKSQSEPGWPQSNTQAQSEVGETLAEAESASDYQIMAMDLDSLAPEDEIAYILEHASTRTQFSVSD